MDEQAEAEVRFRAMVVTLGFDARGLFDGHEPRRDAIAQGGTRLSRGERVMLAFLLTVYDPALKRELLGEVDVLGQLQAVDARGRALVADWVRAPFHVAAG